MNANQVPDPTADGSYRVTANNSENDKRKRLLWLLLALLILLGIIAFLIAKHASDNDATTTTSGTSATTTSQSSNPTSTKYLSSVAAADRTFYFNPDVIDQQDPTQVDNGVAKIAAFYKANSGTKLVVNGSVFEGQPGATGDPLAQQRAALIKQKLVDAGVTASDITTTAVNTYTGNTDAAKAEYARSVTVTAR